MFIFCFSNMIRSGEPFFFHIALYNLATLAGRVFNIINLKINCHNNFEISITRGSDKNSFKNLLTEVVFGLSGVPRLVIKTPIFYFDPRR